MKAETPICRGCLYRSMLRRARITRNNHGEPRAACMCEHPQAIETFNRVCPRSPRMAGFIGYTAMGGDVLQIKTSPKWCPRRPENQIREQTRDTGPKMDGGEKNGKAD
jgi:hypothetical protein